MNKITVAATLGMAFTLAGCDKPTTLCSADADNSAIGQAETAVIFNGASQPHKVCRVSETELKTGKSYRYAEGLLIIKGDVPARTRIEVTNGKLYIDGDIGESARLEANVPTVWKKERYTSTCYNPAMPGALAYTPCRRTRTVFNGYTYNDNDPAMIINGSVGTDVSLTSNRNFHISVLNTARGTNFSKPRYTSNDEFVIKTGLVENYFISPLVR